METVICCPCDAVDWLWTEYCLVTLPRTINETVMAHAAAHLAEESGGDSLALSIPPPPPIRTHTHTSWDLRLLPPVPPWRQLGVINTSSHNICLNLSPFWDQHQQIYSSSLTFGICFKRFCTKRLRSLTDEYFSQDLRH